MSSITGFWTAEEAAEHFGVHRSQITRYCTDQENTLAAIKIGNQWLIKIEDAKAYRPRRPGNPNFQKSA
jgi:excisionase family DNA binding protein